MKLLRLHVENFGALQNFTLSPEDGLNILYQKNGWGKSTLAVFIKAMFYGLPATSRRSLDDNERKKYTPWQGGAFGGSIEFETARGRFRAERFFGAKESNDTFALYDLSTNKPSGVYTAALGEELFGIDADGFERTTYFSQRHLAGSRDNNSISAKLGDFLDDVGDIGNYDVALAALDKRRRYYVMTGNRGAIAEMEEDLLKGQNELERCRRVENAMQEKERELAAYVTEVQEKRREMGETRARLQKAGLARERAVLAEQKDRMLKELAELSAQLDGINAFFHNEPPTADEMNASRALYERIRIAKFNLDSLGTESPDDETLLQLQDRFPNGAPEANVLERVERDNDVLRDIRTRREALQDSQNGEPLLRRFEKGAPDRMQIDSAFESLRRAEFLKKQSEKLSQARETNKQSGVPALLAVLFLLVGAALVILAFQPVAANSMLALLITGGVSLAAGVVLFCLFMGKRSKRLRKLAAMDEQQKSTQVESERELRTVRQFLSSYGMSAEGDLSRALTELSLLTAQYREAVRRSYRVEEELEKLSRCREELCGRLGAFLSKYFASVTEKDDYRAEIEALRRDSATYRRLETEKNARLEARANAEQHLKDLQRQLLPFLRRFDPAGKMRAGECLNRVGEQLAEQRRLTREMEEKQVALTAFIAEKKLGNADEELEPFDLDRLNARERDLQNAVSELQRKQTLLKSEIDRMAVDADRIPDLEDGQKQLKQKINEAKANAATVTNTMKFLEEAKNALSTRYLGGMQESFSRFLSALTGRPAPEATMDTSFEVRLREGGQTRAMESFSRGWRDAVEFCVRLSLTDALYCEGEKPFLLLDDPFVNLDDERLAAARRLLDTLAADYQILYLVCHKERI